MIIPIQKKRKLKCKESNDLLKITVVESAFEPYCQGRFISLTFVGFFFSFCILHEI